MLRSFVYRSDGSTEANVPPESFRDILQHQDWLLWVDIQEPEDSDVAVLLETFELHPLTVEDCIMPSVRPKLEEFDRYLFIVLQALARDNEHLRPLELDVCLGQNFLITVRTEPIKSVNEDWARVERKSPIVKRGPDFLFYALAASLIDSYFPLIEELETHVDQLETRILSQATEEVLKELFRVYDQLTVLRRTLSPHRDIMSRLNRRDDLPFLRPTNAAYFRDSHDQLLRMSDLVDACREVTTMLLEAHATMVSNRLNEIMQKMTAFATLALPMIVLTGIYGMNFGEHPWMPIWVFHLAAVLLVGSIPFMIFFFRKYRWL